LPLPRQGAHHVVDIGVVTRERVKAVGRKRCCPLKISGGLHSITLIDFQIHAALNPDGLLQIERICRQRFQMFCAGQRCLGSDRFRI
jgi:hypothetical protein